LSECLSIYVDGACSGNPGAAGIGVVIWEDSKKILEISKAIGDATNNVAEYSALICALQEANALKAKKVIIYTDSELVYKQIKGQYKIKHEKMKFLHDQVKTLSKSFEEVDLHHIPREKNKDADLLATSSLK